MTKEEDKRQEEQLVEEELTISNFPQEVFVREKEMARKRNQENERMEGRTDGDTSKGKESKRTVTIAYIKGMSEAIRRVLAPLAWDTDSDEIRERLETRSVTGWRAEIA